MARFFGEVGYVFDQVTAPGVHEEVAVGKNYYGDLLKTGSAYRLDAERLNGNLTSNNSISVVADAFAYENFSAIRYVKWSGAYWAVTSVTVEGPRLTLQLGEVYNGLKADSSESSGGTPG